MTEKDLENMTCNECKGHYAMWSSTEDVHYCFFSWSNKEVKENNYQGGIIFPDSGIKECLYHYPIEKE